MKKIVIFLYKLFYPSKVGQKRIEFGTIIFRQTIQELERAITEENNQIIRKQSYVADLNGQMYNHKSNIESAKKIIDKVKDFVDVKN